MGSWEVLEARFFFYGGELRRASRSRGQQALVGNTLFTITEDLTDQCTARGRRIP